MQSFQTLSARGQPVDASTTTSTNNPGSERKAFTAPAFHFTNPFAATNSQVSSTSTTPSQYNQAGNPMVFNASHAFHNEPMDIQDNPTRSSFEARPLMKTASWRGGNRLSRK